MIPATAAVGKRYKKCCHLKDQELLRDASQYAGTTRNELKRLKPSELGENQLLTGYQCGLDYGLRELGKTGVREQFSIILELFVL